MATKKTKKPAKALKKTANKSRGKPFTKGVSGNPNGKPRGTKSYKTLMVEEKLAELGYHPIEAMVQMRKELSGSVVIDSIKIMHSIDKELANYVFPKRKAIEVTQDNKTKPTEEMSDVELAEIAKS